MSHAGGDAATRQHCSVCCSGSRVAVVVMIAAVEAATGNRGLCVVPLRTGH
jgi:hypothetical protein